MSWTYPFVCSTVSPGISLYSGANAFALSDSLVSLNLPESIALNNSFFIEGLATNDLKKSIILLNKLRTASPSDLAGSLPNLKSAKSSAILSLACLSVASMYAIFLPDSLSMNSPFLFLNSSSKLFFSASVKKSAYIASKIS